MDGQAKLLCSSIRLGFDKGDTMKRLAAVPATIAIVFAVLAFHLFGWLLLLALIATALVFWVTTLAEVLRTGPGTQREWWLASLAVVVVLGPIGALAYKLAAPSFARDNNETLRS